MKPVWIRFREGWSRLPDAQQLTVSIWGPGLAIALVLGAIYFGSVRN